MNSPLDNQKRVLVLGSSGFLGGNIRQIYREDEAMFFAHSRGITNQHQRDFIVPSYEKRSIQDLVEKLKIDVLLNCVGFTDVEGCESNPSLNKRLNFDFPLMLTDICQSNRIRLIQVSTDHYASETQEPRSEDTIMSPVNDYGFVKLKADQELLLNPLTLVVRTNFFGFNPSSRSKLFDWAKENLQSGKTLNGFEDVFFSPISVSLLATIFRRLIDLGESGLINAVGSESISKYSFLKTLCARLNIDQSLVIKSSITNSRLVTPRPNYLSLSNTKLVAKMPDIDNMTISKMIDFELARYTPNEHSGT
jgi:dTDP-4-dehydrorhamnose reductase